MFRLFRNELKILKFSKFFTHVCYWCMSFSGLPPAWPSAPRTSSDQHPERDNCQLWRLQDARSHYDEQNPWPEVLERGSSFRQSIGANPNVGNVFRVMHHDLSISRYPIFNQIFWFGFIILATNTQWICRSYIKYYLKSTWIYMNDIHEWPPPLVRRSGDLHWKLHQMRLDHRGYAWAWSQWCLHLGRERGSNTVK